MTARSTGSLDIRMVIPGLPIVAPDPLALSLGGSETAGLQLAAELVRQGHRVTVACNTPETFEWRGVRLQDGFEAAEQQQPYDLFLVQRDPHYLRHGLTARTRFLWLHDQPTVSVVDWPTSNASYADRYLFVSRWQAEQYRAMAPSLADRFAVIRNGIDLELIAEATAGVVRDPFRIAYVSRPERGLGVLLQAVLPRLLVEEPKTRVSIATYGSGQPTQAIEEEQNRLLAARLGDAVTKYSPLGKRELYRLLAGAGLVVFPTPSPYARGFAETSCIAAMEAMACGTAWISTDAGALPETVGSAGVLVPLGDAGHANSREVVEAVVAAALRAMREPAHADTLRTAGYARAAGLGWAPVAERVAELARASIAKPRSVPAPAVARTKGFVATATPVYGYLMHSMCTRSLLLASMRLRDEGYGTGWLTGTTSSIRQGRNRLAAAFLAIPEATHIMWVDADVSFPGDAVSRLLAHDLPMVAGLYPFKKLPPEFPIHLARDEEGCIRRLPSGAVEAELVPGGFVLVKREVYLAMMEAFPERAALCAPEPEPSRQTMAHAPWSFDFYSEHVDRGLFVSEDYAFCRLWRSIGGTVWADLSIRLTHYGMHGFAGDPMELIAPAMQESEAA